MGRAGVWLEWRGSRLNYISLGDSGDIGGLGSIFTCSTEAESASARVKLDARKPGRREAISNVRSIDRNEDTAYVDHPM